MTDYVPLLVPVDGIGYCAPEDDDPESFPVVGLRFVDVPVAEIVFRDLIDADCESDLRLRVQPRLPLGGEIDTIYESEHQGHPVLQIAIELHGDAISGRASAAIAEGETLAFLLCAMCDAPTVHHLCEAERIGLVASLPDDADPASSDEDRDRALLVETDAAAVAFAELWAWRWAFRDGLNPGFSPRRPSSQ